MPATEFEFSIDDYVRVTEYEDGGKKVVIGDYEVHPDASEFDLLPYSELSALADSIEQNGLRQPIQVDSEGRIVDGQNRLLGCLVKGVDPTFETIGGAVREVILDLNIRRRHMTPSQRAILLSKFTGGMPQKKRAEIGKVGVRTQAQADKVVEKGIPELQDAVQNGSVSLHNAVQVADLPPEKQQQVMQEFGKNDRVERPKKKAPKAGGAAEAASEEQSPEEAPAAPAVDPLRAAAAEARAAKATYLDKVRWHSRAENVIGSLLGKVEPDLKDWAKKEIAGIVNATVRLQVENEQKRESFEDSVLDAAGVVEKVGKIVKSLPKSDRAEAERAIGDKYAPKPEPIKKHEQVLSIIDGLSATEKKKLLAALAPEAPAKAAPAAAAELPDDPKKLPDAFRRRVVELAKCAAKTTIVEEDDKKAMVRAVDRISVACAEVLAKTGSWDDDASVSFPEHLDTDEFRSMWREYIDARRESKGHTTNKVQNRWLKVLNHFDMPQAEELLSKAIAGKWMGLLSLTEAKDRKWDGRELAGPAAQFPGKQKQSAPADSRVSHGEQADDDDIPQTDDEYDEMVRRAMNS